MALTDDGLILDEEISPFPGEPDLWELLTKLQQVKGKPGMLTPEELAKVCALSDPELEAVSLLPLKFRARGWRHLRRCAGSLGIRFRNYNDLWKGG